jgi:hypothetical protein
MNPIQKNSGLSARQETTHRSHIALRIGAFRRSIFLTLLAFLALVGTSCRQDTRAQDKTSLRENSRAESDSTNKPKVNVQVNRKYDDKGNLVAFDSTYSAYYSNIKRDTSQMDSLMKRFDAWFGNNHLSLFDKQFNSLFFRDSSRYPDFFHNDFFMKRYELNDPYLRDMMQRMDSVKNRFYREGPKSPAPKGKT